MWHVFVDVRYKRGSLVTLLGDRQRENETLTRLQMMHSPCAGCVYFLEGRDLDDRGPLGDPEVFCGAENDYVSVPRGRGSCDKRKTAHGGSGFILGSSRNSH